MSYLDIKYINNISVYLRNFKNKGNYLYNFSCPYCGDSLKNKTKARGYLKEDKGVWKYYCHNCGKKTNLQKLIEFLDVRLYKEYNLEKFYKNKDKELDNNLFSTRDIIFTKKTELDGLLLRCDQLDEEHECVQYLQKRKIPIKFYKDLYFCDDLSLLKNVFSGYENSVFSREPRLIIPIRNIRKKLIGVNARLLKDNNKKMRYIIMRDQSEEPLIYNIDKVDINKKIYVTEGPIDSMFLQNSVAVSGSDLQKVDNYFTKDKTVYIFDNQPKNKEIKKKMLHLIEKDYNIVIWPVDLVEKDINDMVMNSLDYEKIIEDNIFSGLKAKLKLYEWCR